ncbi:MAG TPA: SET domain-containing protein-lysine N-methyltransferase [Methylomirabilota bacterium]|nr:SET domain-containing protein-lysine N-methyltransferase [Methylomirabilota bacterium]
MTFRALAEVVVLTIAHRLAAMIPAPRTAAIRVLPQEPEPAEHFEVRPSCIPDAGCGLFARRPFARGETLCEYTGDRLTTWEHFRRRDWSYLARCNGFHLDARPYPEVLAARANHHFDPSRRNATFTERDGRLYVVATRDIAAGEEIYVDYGLTYWRLARVGGLIV